MRPSKRNLLPWEPQTWCGRNRFPSLGNLTFVSESIDVSRARNRTRALSNELLSIPSTAVYQHAIVRHLACEGYKGGAVEVSRNSFPRAKRLASSCSLGPGARVCVVTALPRSRARGVIMALLFVRNARRKMLVALPRTLKSRLFQNVHDI